MALPKSSKRIGDILSLSHDVGAIHESPFRDIDNILTLPRDRLYHVNKS